MTRYEDREPISVGVDGTSDGLRAVEYAALQAREQGRPLRLIHAYHVGTLLVPVGPLYVGDDPRTDGVAALDAAERRVRTFGTAIAVDKTLVAAPVVPALVQASSVSALMVVGRRQVNRVERALSGSTSTALAAKGHCPVVSVPDGWRPGTGGRRIVVGVDGSRSGRQAVEFAFAEAARRHAPLVALRSWEVPARWYADIPDVGREDAEWLELMELSLAEDLAGFQSEYPDVQVSRVFERSTSAADALCRRSDGAAMLVVGKRGLGALVGLGLGWTTRSVLAHASCPVAVVHDRDHESTDNRIPAFASTQPQQ